jgi:PAS domain S-box-containing protein
MKDKSRTKEALITELAEQRRRIAELELSEVERKRAEDALRQSEDKYRTIFEATGTATVIIEEDTTISLANREFEKLSGFSKREVEGKKRWPEFVARRDDLERMLNYHTARRIDPNTAPRNYEFKFIDKGGALKEIFATFAVFPGTKKSVGSFLDITERKCNEEALRKSEEQLRFLSTQLMRAQENERKRIAQELHDDLGQILSAIKFGVEDVLHQLGQGVATPGARTLKALIPVVQNGVEEVRRICMDLHPSILDDLGILATMSWFCREFEAIYSGIRIEKEIAVEEHEVPDLLKIVIYRVMQEALNNIAKHSEADLVHLSLRKQGNRIELTIKDNGRGFEPEVARSAERSKRGLGLASMKERVDYSGGSFSVESFPRQGTLIQASWPTP